MSAVPPALNQFADALSSRLLGMPLVVQRQAIGSRPLQTMAFVEARFPLLARMNQYSSSMWPAQLAMPLVQRLAPWEPLPLHRSPASRLVQRSPLPPSIHPQVHEMLDETPQGVGFAAVYSPFETASHPLIQPRAWADNSMVLRLSNAPLRLNQPSTHSPQFGPFDLNPVIGQRTSPPLPLIARQMSGAAFDPPTRGHAGRGFAPPLPLIARQAVTSPANAWPSAVTRGDGVEPTLSTGWSLIPRHTIGAPASPWPSETLRGHGGWPLIARQAQDSAFAASAEAPTRPSTGMERGIPPPLPLIARHALRGPANVWPLEATQDAGVASMPPPPLPLIARQALAAPPSPWSLEAMRGAGGAAPAAHAEWPLIARHAQDSAFAVSVEEPTRSNTAVERGVPPPLPLIARQALATPAKAWASEVLRGDGSAGSLPPPPLPLIARHAQDSAFAVSAESTRPSAAERGVSALIARSMSGSAFIAPTHTSTRGHAERGVPAPLPLIARQLLAAPASRWSTEAMRGDGGAGSLSPSLLPLIARQVLAAPAKAWASEARQGDGAAGPAVHAGWPLIARHAQDSAFAVSAEAPMRSNATVERGVPAPLPLIARQALAAPASPWSLEVTRGDGGAGTLPLPPLPLIARQALAAPAKAWSFEARQGDGAAVPAVHAGWPLIGRHAQDSAFAVSAESTRPSAAERGVPAPLPLIARQVLAAPASPWSMEAMRGAGGAGTLPLSPLPLIARQALAAPAKAWQSEVTRSDGAAGPAAHAGWPLIGRHAQDSAFAVSAESTRPSAAERGVPAPLPLIARQALVAPASRWSLEAMRGAGGAGTLPLSPLSLIARQALAAPAKAWQSAAMPGDGGAGSLPPSPLPLIARQALATPANVWALEATRSAGGAGPAAHAGWPLIARHVQNSAFVASAEAPTRPSTGMERGVPAPLPLIARYALRGPAKAWPLEATRGAGAGSLPPAPLPLIARQALAAPASPWSLEAMRGAGGAAPAAHAGGPLRARHAQDSAFAASAEEPTRPSTGMERGVPTPLPLIARQALAASASPWSFEAMRGDLAAQSAAHARWSLIGRHAQRNAFVASADESIRSSTMVEHGFSSPLPLIARQALAAPASPWSLEAMRSGAAVPAVQAGWSLIGRHAQDSAFATSEEARTQPNAAVGRGVPPPLPLIARQALAAPAKAWASEVLRGDLAAAGTLSLSPLPLLARQALAAPAKAWSSEAMRGDLGAAPAVQMGWPLIGRHAQDSGFVASAEERIQSSAGVGRGVPPPLPLIARQTEGTLTNPWPTEVTRGHGGPLGLSRLHATNSEPQAGMWGTPNSGLMLLQRTRVAWRGDREDMTSPLLTPPFVSRLIDSVKADRAINTAPAGLLALAVQRAATMEMLEHTPTEAVRGMSQPLSAPLLQLQRLNHVEAAPIQLQHLAHLEPSAMPLISTPPAVFPAVASSPIQRTETEQPQSNANQATVHQPNPAQMEQLAREVYARLRRRLRIDRERRG